MPFVAQNRCFGRAKSVSAKRPNLDKVWDPYCWVCHQKDTNQRCSTCIQSYHSACIGSEPIETDEYQCDLCINMQQAEQQYAKQNENLPESMGQLHRMFAHVIDRLCENTEFQPFKSCLERLHWSKKGPDIINPFDLEIIREKVQDKMYKSTVEFLKDIRLIRHNAEITLKPTSKRLAAAKELEAWCDKEMYDIEICKQCFSRVVDNDSDWFTKACDPPHLLVWAKMKDNPYWPAKVLGQATIGNSLDVRFFGDYGMYYVQPSQCYIFSSTDPNQHKNPKIQQDIKVCLKEVNEYIKEIEERYQCTFRKAPPKKPLNIKRIGEMLTNMIPTLKLPSGYLLKRKPSFLRRTKRKSAAQPLASSTPMSSCEMRSVRLPPPLTPLPALSYIQRPKVHINLSEREISHLFNVQVRLIRCDHLPEYAEAVILRDNLANLNGPNGVASVGPNDNVDWDRVSTTEVSDSSDEDEPLIATENAQNNVDDKTAVVNDEDNDAVSLMTIDLVSESNDDPPNDGDHSEEQIDWDNLQAAMESMISENQRMKENETKMKAANDQLTAENAQLKATIAELTAKLTEVEHQAKLDKIQFEAELKVALNEDNEYCNVCRKPIDIKLYSQFEQPVCGLDCLMSFWKKKGPSHFDVETILEIETNHNGEEAGPSAVNHLSNRSAHASKEANQINRNGVTDHTYGRI